MTVYTIWSGTARTAEKRALVIRTILQRTGFAAQRDLVGQLPWSEMPALTLDVAMVLVEGGLRRAGATGGATRDEIRSAMDDLVRSLDAFRLPMAAASSFARKDEREPTISTFKEMAGATMTSKA